MGLFGKKKSEYPKFPEGDVNGKIRMYKKGKIKMYSFS